MYKMCACLYVGTKFYILVCKLYKFFLKDFDHFIYLKTEISVLKDQRCYTCPYINENADPG